MRSFSREPVSIAVACHGLMFIGLNIADAWLTQRLLAIGGAEGNWWGMLFGASELFSTNLILIKVLLATGVILVLIWLGKSKLLWLLNVGISVVVLMNGVCFLSYLAGLYNWF